MYQRKPSLHMISEQFARLEAEAVRHGIGVEPDYLRLVIGSSASGSPWGVTVVEPYGQRTLLNLGPTQATAMTGLTVALDLLRELRTHRAE